MALRSIYIYIYLYTYCTRSLLGLQTIAGGHHFANGARYAVTALLEETGTCKSIADVHDVHLILCPNTWDREGRVLSLLH